MTIVDDRDLRHAERQLGDPHLSVPPADHAGRYCNVHPYGTKKYRTVTIPFDVPRAWIIRKLCCVSFLVHISSVASSARCDEEFRCCCQDGNECENGDYLSILFITNEWIALIYHVFHFPRGYVRYLGLIRNSRRAEIWCAYWRRWCMPLGRVYVCSEVNFLKSRPLNFLARYTISCAVFATRPNFRV